MVKKYSGIYVLVLLIMPAYVFAQHQNRLIDVLATEETKNLYTNLAELSKHAILFGHQHATEYGHGWQGDEGRSDVKSVTGSHPAVIGVDFSGLSGRPESMIEKEKIALRKTIEDTYNRGGVTTVAWHFSNPVSAGGFYWKDSISAPAVRLIIPGGSHHEKYKQILQTIAGFVNSVKGKDGKTVPMIFRPYHELDGNWFWWGKPHCSAAEFKTLWKFTVSYLRDSLSVHNFIYAFSPDNSFINEKTYLERYPGNEWVDIVGIDDYNDFGRYGRYRIDSGIARLKIVNDYALKSKKLAAFTETGLESIPNTLWWTEVLLRSLRKEKLQMAYVLVWRNDRSSATHFYAPYPGQASERDFIEFYNDPYTLFENDLPKMYEKNNFDQPVKKYGRLKVTGTKLADQYGNNIALHGMSLGWSCFHPRFYTAGTVEWLHRNWNCNVVRAALGVEPKNGYIEDPVASVRLIQTVVDAAIKEGIYVIIDWHSHNINLKEAKTFFAEMAEKYAGHPNIIYELFNEPDYETWPQVKAYAIEIISTIRRFDKNNIILVGSPRWDQEIMLPANDPIQGFDNLMYTVHFYAGTHRQWLRNRTDSAIKKGLPVFISECAGMEATGGGSIDYREWQKYIDWMDKNKLSWVAWSVSDKDETCSVLKKSAASTGNWQNEDLKESGIKARALLKNYVLKE